MVDGGGSTEKEGRAVNQDEQIKEYNNEISTYLGTVVIIEDDTTDAAFAEFFADVRGKRKEIEEWFDSIKKPLNESLRKLNNKQNELCNPLRDLEDKITQARGAWLGVKNRAAAEADRLAIEEANKTGSVAILSQAPTKTVATDSGKSVTLASQKSWRLTDDKTMTARKIDRDKIKIWADDPRVQNVPKGAFQLVPSMVQALLKTGSMPEGEHSIEQFEEPKSQLK